MFGNINGWENTMNVEEKGAKKQTLRGILYSTFVHSILLAVHVYEHMLIVFNLSFMLMNRGQPLSHDV
jgi:hypothetical protein